MGVHRNIDANFLRGMMPKVPSKKHPYENFGMPYVFLWILHDAAFKRVTACSGCDHCGLGAADCVYRDDMFELNPHLIDADLIVLSTPLYYFGFSAQLKLVIDRFYAINSQLHSPRKAVLLAAAWNSNDWTFPALAHHYETLVRYMGWEDVGQILGTSCGTRSQTENTEFPRLAYELGKKVCARA